MLHARRLLAVLALPAALLVAAPAATAEPGPLRILTIGDSLTAGYGGADTLGYRRELGARLADAEVEHVFTNGGGSRGGWTVQDLRTGIDGWLAADQPDLVLIAIGTNNAAGAGPGMNGFEPAYIGLVNRILAWNPTVKVAVTQVTYSNAAWSPNLVAVNVAAIHAAWWAQPAGRSILADMSTIHPCRTFDGVHMRDDGYDQMGRQWYRALAAAYGWPALTYLDHLPAQRRPGIERTSTVTC